MVSEQISDISGVTSEQQHGLGETQCWRGDDGDRPRHRHQVPRVSAGQGDPLSSERQYRGHGDCSDLAISQAHRL